MITNRDSPLSAQDEAKLMQRIWDPEIADDPLAFVMFIFPWGKAGTPLADEQGPRTWQRKKLEALRDHIARNKNKGILDLPYEILQDATSSGRGIGKSSLTSWLILWMLSTRPGSTTIVTANTEQQLKSRTWAELGKWHTFAINGHWFDRAALSLKPQPWLIDAIKRRWSIDSTYYYAAAQLWSEENPDAFAGAHNPLGMLLLFDEASGIPEAIWKVSKGFFTEKKALDRYWFVFSNPRRNTGSFFECFYKNRDFWQRTQIDARTVEDTDPSVYEQIIREHGPDSYDARVEVMGLFPVQGERQFISRDSIEEATTRELTPDSWAPLIMGVDPARYGDDSTVIRWRQGRDGKILPPTVLKGKDNMEVANACAHLITQFQPDAVCVDVGNGTGIIDRLREMGYKVHEVAFGGKSPNEQWANNRTFLWAEMRDWLKGGVIDNHSDLKDDLAGPEYKFMGTSDKLRLETKEEMKSRGLSSPDHGDALACTFAIKVARKDRGVSRGGRFANSPQANGSMASGIDYDFFS